MQENSQNEQQEDMPSSAPEINHTLLRSILALLSRLPLLLPPANISSFKQETLSEKSDVELTSLLGLMGRSVREAKELGRKFGVVEGLKTQGKKQFLNMGAAPDDYLGNGNGGQDLIDGGYMM